MYRACAFVGGEQHDEPLDLAPPAEVDHVAELAAAIGTRGGLAGGVNAEMRDQLGRVDGRRGIGKMDVGLQGRSRSDGA